MAIDHDDIDPSEEFDGRDPEDYEKMDDILHGHAAMYAKEIPRMEEVQAPAIRTCTELVQKLNGIMHEDALTEVEKLEVACAWASILDRITDYMKKEIGPRLMKLYKGSTDDLPFTLDDKIPIWVRSSYMTRVNMKLTEEAKKDYGVDIFRDTLIKG